MPGSGPRRHDAPQRLIAPRARRGTLLPPLHRCCPGDAERAGNAGDHAKLTPSTAAATTKSPPPSSVLRRQPRPAQPRPKPPPNQIPINGKPPIRPPRVPSWGAFGRRPQHRWLGHDRPASETLHLSGHCRQHGARARWGWRAAVPDSSACADPHGSVARVAAQRRVAVIPSAFPPFSNASCPSGYICLAVRLLVARQSGWEGLSSRSPRSRLLHQIGNRFKPVFPG